jgi:ABC-type branched-subunit amino acid transport system permease subunit
MIKEMADLATTVAVNKIADEKQELERRLAFWVFKGAFAALALVFLVVALFIMLTGYVSMSMAATITAIVCLAAGAFIHLIQLEFNKTSSHKKEEWVKIFVPLVEAFAEGLADKERGPKVTNI